LDLTADLCTALFLHAIMLLKQEIKSLGSAKWMQSRQDSFVVTWDHFLNREHTWLVNSRNWWSACEGKLTVHGLKAGCKEHFVYRRAVSAQYGSAGEETAWWKQLVPCPGGRRRTDWSWASVKPTRALQPEMTVECPNEATVFHAEFFYSFVCLSQDRASERYRSQQRGKNELKYHLENGRIIEAPTELVQPVTQSRPKQLLPWHACWPKSVDKLPRPTVKQQREKGRSFVTFTDGRSQSFSKGWFFHPAKALRIEPDFWFF
jgi:hypothetical protein